MAQDLFSKGFDHGTNAKLEIFKLYFREWLPVFISSYERHYWDSIFIYDFFAGVGKDINGNLGSPLVILEMLNEYSASIEKANVKIYVILNEKKKSNYKKLEKNISEYDYNRNIIDVRIYNQDFKELFTEIYPLMMKKKEYPRLLFLDQYGIKEITEDIYKKLISFKRSDFIFFISSSFIRRFNELQEFKSYIEIKKEKFDESKPFHCHKIVFDYYKSLTNTDYKIAPFSIKKNKNIYGLIFGSNHTLGLEKFLRVAWKINPHTGDANFNIDEESIILGQQSIFEEDNKIRKVSLFENLLKDRILNKKLKTLHECYVFTLEYGCQPKHCNTVLNELIKGGYISEVRTKNEKIHTLAPPNDILIDFKK